MKKLFLYINILIFCFYGNVIASIDGEWIGTKSYWDHVKERKDASGAEWQYTVSEWFDATEGIKTYRCEDAIIRVKDNKIISRTWRIRTNIMIKKIINQKKQSIKFEVIKEEHDDDMGTIRTMEVNIKDLTQKVKFIWFNDKAYIHNMDLLSCDFLNRYVQSVIDGQTEYKNVRASMTKFNAAE